MTAYVRQATAVSSQRAMEVFERLNSLVNLVIGAANTVAGKTMFDAIESTEDTVLPFHSEASPQGSGEGVLRLREASHPELRRPHAALL